ncbi:MAG: hypothetical protein JRL30_17135 [Deltaproteobacteria bacterium]|nr:hypothetical protein [Deltaproteobacteria bacterium]
MKKRLIILALLVFSGMFSVTSWLMGDDQSKGWAGNFVLFRSHFKSLPKSDVVYCERLLKGILYELDTNNRCNGDDDCELIDQDPFGATVPFPKNHIVSMKARMKEYCERCDDGFSHSVRNDDLVNKPVCVNGKCMVSTRFKKEP